MQRFDALKVGDTVTFRYYETLVTAVSKPGATPKEATPSTAVTRTPGAAPGGTVGRQITATVTLEAIDPKTPAVTIRTADGRRSSFRIADAKNLEGYKVGDQVSITYTRALAVSVTPGEVAPAEPRHIKAAAPRAATARAAPEHRRAGRGVLAQPTAPSVVRALRRPPGPLMEGHASFGAKDR